MHELPNMADPAYLLIPSERQKRNCEPIPVTEKNAYANIDYRMRSTSPLPSNQQPSRDYAFTNMVPRLDQAKSKLLINGKLPVKAETS